MDITERLQAACEIGTQLTGMHELPDLIELAIRSIRKQLQYENVALALIEGDDLAFLGIAYAYNDKYFFPVNKPPFTMKIGEGISSRAAQTGETVYVPDVTLASEYLEWNGLFTAEDIPPMRSEMAIPLKKGDRVIGVLNIESVTVDGFSKEDQLILELMAKQIAASIENVRMLSAIDTAKEQYKSLFDRIPVGIYRTTPDGRVLDANPTIVEIMGSPDLQQVLSASAYDNYLNPEDRRAWMAKLEQAGVLDEEFQARRRYDGTFIWVRERCRVVRGENGEVLYYEGMIEDITDQKRAEQALAHEYRLQQAEIAIRVKIVSIDQPQHLWLVVEEIGRQLKALEVAYDSCSIQIINDAGTDFISFGLFPYSKEWDRLIGDWGEVSDNAIEYPWVLEVWKTGIPRYDPCVTHHLLKGSARSLIDVAFCQGTLSINKQTADAFTDEHIAILQRFAHVLTDGYYRVQTVIERTRADRLLVAYQKKLRTLTVERSFAEEHERRRIASELHDSIGQTLALTRIKLGMLHQAHMAKDLETLTAECRDLIDTAIAGTRSLTLEISPPVLYTLGLVEAIDWLLEHLNKQNGLICSYEHEGFTAHLDDNMRALLYAIVRELLINILKHARTQQARIHMEQVDHEIHIRVEDSGVGFDLERHTDGFGLFDIRERMTHFGAHLEIDTAPNQGTRVLITVPVRQD